MDPEAIIKELLLEEKLLEAARKLRRPNSPCHPSSCSERRSSTAANNGEEEPFQSILRDASEMEDAIADLLSDPDDTWTKQGESNDGEYFTTIYYKVEDTSKLYCRIDTPIPQKLLLPLLSVLNEVDLYDQWIPSWTVPKVGVEKCFQLKRVSRGEQYIYVRTNTPWPLSSRDVLLRIKAVDDIDARQIIAVTIKSSEMDGYVSDDDSTVRANFDGAMLFRANPENEEQILVSFKMFVDPKMNSIPTTLINFVTRTVIGQIWSMLLRVAEEVRDKKRPNHLDSIDRKPAFYQWVHSRVEAMLEMNKISTSRLPMRNAISTEENDDSYRHFISYLQS